MGLNQEIFAYSQENLNLLKSRNDRKFCTNTTRRNLNFPYIHQHKKKSIHEKNKMKTLNKGKHKKVPSININIDRSRQISPNNNRISLTTNIINKKLINRKNHQRNQLDNRIQNDISNKQKELRAIITNASCWMDNFDYNSSCNNKKKMTTSYNIDSGTKKGFDKVISKNRICESNKSHISEYEDNATGPEFINKNILFTVNKSNKALVTNKFGTMRRSTYINKWKTYGKNIGEIRVKTRQISPARLNIVYSNRNYLHRSINHTKNTVGSSLNKAKEKNLHYKIQKKILHLKKDKELTNCLCISQDNPQKGLFIKREKEFIGETNSSENSRKDTRVVLDIRHNNCKRSTLSIGSESEDSIILDNDNRILRPFFMLK